MIYLGNLTSPNFLLNMKNSHITYYNVHFQYNSSLKSTLYRSEIHYKNSLAPMTAFPISKFSLSLFAASVFILFLVFLYDLLYFYFKIPDSIHIRLNIGILHSFFYIKQFPDLSPYFPFLYQLLNILFIALLQWIVINCISRIISNYRLKHIIVSTLYYSFTVFSIYQLWFYTRMHYSSDVTLFNVTPFSPSIFTPPAPLQSLLLSRTQQIIDSSVPFLNYLADRNISSAPYLSLFNTFNFNINNAYVLNSNSFAYAMIIKYPTHSNIFICDNLLHNSHFDFFRAVFYHEMGHYTLNHGSSIIIGKLVFLLAVIILLIYNVPIRNRADIRRLVNILCAVFISVFFFRMICNLHTQVFEYEADRFACKTAPDVVTSLAFALLQDLKFIGNAVNHRISPSYFIYPDMHPLYTHPSKMNRILELNDCIN